MKERTAKDAGEQNVLNHVRDFGWSVMQVFDPKGKLPNFSYSIGMFESLQSPEIIIFGLENDNAKRLINDIGQKVKEGYKIKPFEKTDLFFHEPCIAVFIPVDKKHYREHFGFDIWFYEGIEFPVYQCVWSDEKGVMPWEEGFNVSLNSKQPLLGLTPPKVGKSKI